MNFINTELQVIQHDHVGNDGSAECYTEIELNNKGMSYILKDLEMFSNFTSNLTIKSWGWGNVTEDKFESEVVPEFSHGQADLAVSYYLFTTARLQKAVALHPIIDYRFWAFFRQPHFTSVRNIYDEPFSQELFISIFCLIMLYTLITCIAIKTLNLYNFKNSIQEALWFVVSFICLKSYDFHLKQPTFQILFLCGSFLFVLLFAIYSAFLTSVLTRNPAPINSIADLTQYGFTFFASPTIRSSVPNEVLNKQSMALDAKIAGTSQELRSLKKAMAGGHVHIDELDGLLLSTERLGMLPRKLCTVISQLPVSTIGNTVVGGFFVPRSSAFGEALKVGLLRVRNAGLINRYTKLHTYDFSLQICTKVKVKYQNDLGISHVFSAFLVLLVFFSVSLSILLLELYSFK